MDNNKNLESGRYKICGYGKLRYNREGEYDEVYCGYNKDGMGKGGWCGDCPCPLDEEVQSGNKS